MESERAIRMIHRLLAAEVNIVNQEHTSRGVTKKALEEERKATAALFLELAGFHPKPEDIEAMTQL